MVRLTLLAGAVTALCASMVAPAQAGVLPDDLGASATTTVQQAATGATDTVRTTVNAAGETTAASTHQTAPAAEPVVQHATAIAQPAAEGTSQTVARVTSTRTDDGRPPAGISSSAGHAARADRPRGHGHVGASAAQGGPRAALAHPLRTAAPAPAAANRASEPRRTTSGDRSPRPDGTPSSPEGTPASAPAGAFAFGGVALLTACALMAGPRLRRRLVIRPAALRPVAFVALLERPG